MLNHLAAPRMLAVKNYFKTETKSELLGSYAWTQALSSGLLPIIGDFEVAFRNAVHVALSQYYGNSDSYNWMMTTPNPAKATNPAAKPLPAPHKMSPETKEDIKRTVKKIKLKKGTVTQDDVVAALTFGFWEQIINSLDNSAHPSGFQAAILSKIFPFAPDLHVYPYSSDDFKKRVVSILTRIREARNRIGHHDSIWSVPEFNEMGKIGFIPRRPRHTINALNLFTNRVCWFAGWINQDITSHIVESDHWWSFQSLLTRNALLTYQITGGKVGTYKSVLNTIGPLHEGRSQNFGNEEQQRAHQRRLMKRIRCSCPYY